MSEKIILDCDPGLDDAIAIIMALASDKIDVKAVTTGAGNQTQEKTSNNALKVLSFLGAKDIEVAKGALKPLSRDLVIADSVHGDTGLNGADIPESTMKISNRSALEVMVDVLKNSKEKITIVSLGPLTNIAILLLTHPELKSKIKNITMMAGACFGGNITPNSEFNVYVDPEAADIVFKSGVPIVMIGLDVTRKAQVFKSEVEEIRNIGNETSKMVAGILDFYGKSVTPYFLAEEGYEEGCHLHDPCAVAYLIAPEIFKTIDCNVVVDTRDGLTCGCTVVDYDGVTGREINAKVAFELQREVFMKLLIQSINKFK